VARLERRLRKLEARLTDRSRLVPHTPQWFDYWTEKLDRLVNGELVDEKLPVEFLDALMTIADAAAAGALTEQAVFSGSIQVV
jgi:hypothetical protein